MTNQTPVLHGSLAELEPQEALEFFLAMMEQTFGTEEENMPLLLAENTNEFDENKARYGCSMVVSPEGGVQEALVIAAMQMYREGFFPTAVALFSEGWVSLDAEALKKGRKPSDDPRRGEGVLISVATPTDQWTLVQIFTRVDGVVVLDPEGPQVHHVSDGTEGDHVDGAVPTILENMLRLQAFGDYVSREVDKL